MTQQTCLGISFRQRSGVRLLLAEPITDRNAFRLDNFLCLPHAVKALHRIPEYQQPCYVKIPLRDDLPPPGFGLGTEFRGRIRRFWAEIFRKLSFVW
jgi:hypothetical protein